MLFFLPAFYSFTQGDSTVSNYQRVSVLGTVAYRQDWLRTIPNSRGVVGLVIAVAVSLVLFPISWLSGQYQGNGTWQSAVYALWESTFAVGILLGADADLQPPLRRGRDASRTATHVCDVLAQRAVPGQG